MFYKFFPFLSSVRLIINLFDANQMSSFQNMSDFFFGGGGGGRERVLVCFNIRRNIQRIYVSYR